MVVQLQTALNSRVLIEQAKGVLAERLNLDMDQAFTTLRGHARTHNRKLSDLARAVIAGTEHLTAAPATPTPKVIDQPPFPRPARRYQRRGRPEDAALREPGGQDVVEASLAPTAGTPHRHPPSRDRA